jgi:hypothetical protein
MGYNLELEESLKKLGFKKKYLNDKSGYWMEKPVKFLDLKGKIYLQSDSKVAFLEIQTYDFYLSKLKKANTETVLKIKCDLPSIKAALKKYDR